MVNTDKKYFKGAALITYCLAIVCLLLGLLLPLGTVKGVDGIIALQLPDALNKAFGLNIGGGKPFLYSYPVKLFGVVPEIDFGAWLILAYVLVTAAAIVCLIPALAGSKEKHTTEKITFVVEAVAAAILVVLVLTFFYDYIEIYLRVTTPTGFSKVWGHNLTIAAAGLVLMLIIQRIICDKGSGVVKTLLFLLSAAAVIFTVYNVYRLFLQATLRNLANSIGMESGIYGTADGASVYAILHVSAFLGGNYFGSFLASYEGGLEKTLAVFTLLLGLVVLINLMLDMLGIARKTSKAMLKCNQVRYILELVLIIAVIVFALVLKYTIGIMLVILAIIAVIQYWINLVRLVTFGKYASRKKKPKGLYATDEETEGYEYYDETENAAASAVPATEEPAPEAVGEPVVETRNIIYNVQTLYNGPTDDFINKLTNEEKIEFAKIFLEKNNPDLSSIPDYKVGGNNAKFFSNIMIYYARVRDLVSDGLMNKMYKECKMM